MAAPSARLQRLAPVGDGLSSALRRLRLTPNGGLLVGAAVAGWWVARWIGSRSLFLMVYAWGLTMAVSWLAARRRMHLDVDRSDVPRRMREGQVIPVELRITASRRASTVVVQEHLPAELGRAVHVPVAALAPGEAVEHRYSVTPSLRGVYRVGPATVTWSDPFGLTVHEQHLADEIEVVVHPRTEPVHDRVLTRMWEDPPIRPPVSKPWPTGFEFYGMRDYVPGDDLRTVVWSAVAKTGRMLVRESEQGITDRVTIVLDTDPTWHSPGRPSLTFETGVRTAASIGVHHLKDGFAVSLLANDGPVAAALRGGRADLRLLDALARVQPGGPRLADVSPHLLAEARRGTHVLLVTPHLDDDAASAVRLVSERGASVTAAVLVWDESDPRSLARAASLGCEVVQVPHDTSLEAVFSRHVGAGVRR